MSDTDFTGHESDTPDRADAPVGDVPAPDDAPRAGDAGAGPPKGGMAVPPQRASDRPGWGGVDEAGIGGGPGDAGGGDEIGRDLGPFEDAAAERDADQTPEG